MGNRLGDLIAQGEGGYNSYNRGSAGDARGATIDFSRMTVGELQEAQHLPRRDPDRLFAVGKYQIIPGTMDGAVRGLRLDPDQRFTPELQERIFSDYLIVQKRPDIRGYITGKPGVSLHDAQEAMAAEWASVADPDTGRSRYGGVGGNRASISAERAGEALQAMRAEYKAAIDQGLTPQAAWRAVTDSSPTQGQTHATPRAPERDAMADGVLKRGEHGAEVRGMQETLNKLGYRDAQGHPLKADGDFGDRSKQALQAFQQAHGLKDDGIAGPKTLEALKKAEQAPLLSNAAHPEHAMFKGAVDGLEKLGPQAFHNRQELERAAATLTYEAKVSGLNRIDHVVPNADGSGLFAVQGGLTDPGSQRAHVNKAQAANQPVEQSTFQVQQDAPQQAAPTQEHKPKVLTA